MEDDERSLEPKFSTLVPVSLTEGLHPPPRIFHAKHSRNTFAWKSLDDLSHPTLRQCGFRLCYKE